ncbi:hypothetical protein CH369_18060 [Leptospira levettii]|uniref:hypothetical protein n=1 Tax=Leptospira levettii TaxID=2023178 RepID=UPI000C2AC4F4|nr:hypothetical protein [Leptospira levettii]PJZ98870.1 hypothetical protein CH369_18060 [Leptospira levettii]
MASLPSQKKILEQDLGTDIPSWTRKLLTPINSFFESIYSAFNKDITFRENIRCEYRDLIVKTKEDYSSGEFELITFKNNLKEKIDNLQICQVSENKSNFIPVKEPVTVSWNEYNKEITIHYITGLENSKEYKIKIIIY